ncbi:RagB/SusD family nutrient uptake outer membrane protein [Larkinella knui]|uniref:RagB/SusD family nutrient uptake outer membrane protein n=1 Tax=Larkinella knui TaxID=2025310 RepID=A0A3P1CGK4_9BACT|nr:RagB/SusD family nutrient uptake outer membrane protein [Larkinella knui]RRB12395.1 RagB/SusD family nutrient uptake outer membrane protein [Larkinella knui]
MKNKLSRIGLGLSVFLMTLTSCQNDFLDKNPLDSISSATFWANEDDVNMALAGVYARLRGGFFGYRRPWLDCYSDNAYDRFNYYNFQNLTQGIVNNTNVNSAFYDVPYQGIASSNFFLDNVDKAPIPDARKNVVKAEARFLRALFYYDLVMSFGGVVIYKSLPATVDASKVKQSTKAEVLAFIQEDLDFAIANLPEAKYDGHAVKGTAMGLKTRVLLVQEKWADAAALAKQIMDAGTFSLAPSYKGLFLTATQNGNPEIMFSTKFLAPNNYHGDFAGSDVELGWWGAINVYANLAEEYEMKSGKMITEAGSGYDPANPGANRDPRLAATVRVPGEKYINPDGTEFLYSDVPQTPYMMKKYIDFSRLPFGYTKANLTDQNIVHLRYADILLMYAEAKNEATGPDASVYAALNQIRARPDVAMPPVNQTVYNTQAKLRDFIRHERRVELALEGYRYFDLKRWKTIEARLATVKNPAGLPLKFGEKNYVLPFPQTELDRNRQLVQNEGY